MSLFRPPATSLDRARWYCLLACFANIAGLGAIFFFSNAPPIIVAIEQLALVATGGLLTHSYRKGRMSLGAAGALAACLYLCAFLYPDPNLLTALLYMTICFASLEASVRRLIAPVALLAGSYLAAVVTIDHTVRAFASGAQTLAPIPIISLVFAAFAATLARFERAIATEVALADASAMLVAATDAAAVHEAAVKGCHVLVGGGDARVSMWLSRGAHHVPVASAGPAPQLDLPEAWSRGEYSSARLVANSTVLQALPLESRGGRQGVLVAATRGPLSVERLRIATAFARQAAMAIESVALVEQMRASEARFRSLVQHTSDAVSVLDEAGRIVFASPAIENLFETKTIRIDGALLSDLVDREDRDAILDLVTRASHRALLRQELPLRTRTGLRHVEVTATNLLEDPNVQGIVVVLHDISERKALETRLEHQAFHDSLTGLANRVLFMDRLRVALARASRLNTRVAVLFIDLDNFKAINDGFGHAAGDEALVVAASRLRTCLRGVDTAARLGGDELAAILEGTDSPEDAARVAERFLASMQAPARIQGREITLSASIGIALSGDAGDEVEELVASADLAMYEAKHRGKNCCVVADPRARAKIQHQLELQTDLRQALPRGELELVFRPMVSLASGRIIGVEALPRWNQPRRKALLPSDIMSAAESIGAASTLGSWMLSGACSQVMKWNALFPATPLLVSVRLSTRQLARAGFTAEAAATMSAAGINPRRVIFELCGGSTRDSDDIANKLHALKEVGVRLAIDGLGTGRASLVAFPRLPLDLVKIDKTFVDGIGGFGGGTMAYAITTLSRILRIEVIAEGIERLDQVEMLKGFGCDLGEGRYFSPPLNAAGMTSLLGAAQPPWPVETQQTAIGLAG